MLRQSHSARFKGLISAEYRLEIFYAKAEK